LKQKKARSSSSFELTYFEPEIKLEPRLGPTLHQTLFQQVFISQIQLQQMVLFDRVLLHKLVCYSYQQSLSISPLNWHCNDLNVARGYLLLHLSFTFWRHLGYNFFFSFTILYSKLRFCFFGSFVYIVI